MNRLQRMIARLVGEGDRLKDDVRQETADEMLSWVEDVESFVDAICFCLDCDAAVIPEDGKCRTCGGSNFARDEEGKLI